MIILKTYNSVLNSFSHHRRKKSIKFLLRTQAKYPIKSLHVVYQKYTVVYGAYVCKS